MIGKKLNMSQLYDSHGRATAVTAVSVETHTIVAVKEKETDGYKAVQVGVGQAKKTTKALEGHFKKANLKTNPRHIREVDFEGEVKSGTEIKMEEVFHKGGMVDVIGTSKGKGFAGAVKRHGFHGGPKTHGQSDRHRAPGSIGSGTTPGRVMKGQKMPGHMGVDRVTVIGLEIMEVDKEEGRLLVKGSLPGASGSIVLLVKSRKKREAYHEPEIPAQPVVVDSGEPETEEAKLDEKVEEAKTDVKEAPKAEEKAEG
ncbi:MAG TPA: 50S ribosomal protein L3 [Candidatus Saccharimonadales bacterium]|nr:50S ribosomal protein L3 [Candidatus Saccharimonadales bacterium]